MSTEISYKITQHLSRREQ